MKVSLVEVIFAEGQVSFNTNTLFERISTFILKSEELALVQRSNQGSYKRQGFQLIVPVDNRLDSLI